MSGPHVVIMAGGTGGHVFPALSVARALTERGVSVSWLGTRRGLEAELVPSRGFPIDYVDIAGLRGKGMGGWLLAPIRIMRAVMQAARIIRARQADAVLGMGGFVTGPGGIAAKLLGRPLLIHEQNSIPGLTNKLLSRLADRVMEAFAETLPGAEVTGNPIRKEIRDLAAPGERYDGRHGAIRVLVLGGSQGARALNEEIPRAVAAIPAAQRPEVRHQSGKANLETARKNYAASRVNAEVTDFVDDMAEAYSWADLVICRAGALTVSELAAAGMPAVLVPFPFAVDDHQSANAHFLVDAGAGILLPQDELTRVGEILTGFCADPDAGRQRLKTMAEAALALARPEATDTVTEICLRALERSRG